MSPSPMTIDDVLFSWLSVRLPPDALEWLRSRRSQIAEGDRQSLFLTFGLVPRKLGKSDLKLTPEEQHQAESARPGWNAEFWTIDQTARLWLLRAYAAQGPTAFQTALDQLFAAGEVQELVALYQGLSLLPFPEQHRLRCAEGLRTNIPAVFTAIVHRNAFPSEQLNDDQWNQLVLKSLFIGIPLHPIVGLNDRRNSKLAAMLLDFARERRAAGRKVPPELWRCVGPFLDAEALPVISAARDEGTKAECQAIGLALQECSDERCRQLLSSWPWQLSEGSWTELAIASE